MPIMFHDKHIARNIIWIRCTVLIAAWPHPSPPIPRQQRIGWRVVVVAVGAWACFVCCEIEVTHQIHWRRAYPCGRARDRMISCRRPHCPHLLNIVSGCSPPLLLMCLLLKHQFLMMRRAWEPCLAEVAQCSHFSFESIPHLWMVASCLPVACACVLAPNSQIFVDR